MFEKSVKSRPAYPVIKTVKRVVSKKKDICFVA